MATKEELLKRGPRGREEFVELARYQLADLRRSVPGAYEALQANVTNNGIGYCELDPAKTSEELGREILELRERIIDRSSSPVR